MPNGIITYAISIIGEDLIDGTIVLNTSTTVNSTELVVEVQPYSTYTVVVTSRTGAGDGDPVTISFETPEASKW